MSPAKTLKAILSIVDKDIRVIKKNSRNEKTLKPEEALTLLRYGMLLHKIVEQHWTDKQKAKRKFEQMSTLQLESLRSEQTKEKR